MGTKFYNNNNININLHFYPITVENLAGAINSSAG